MGFFGNLWTRIKTAFGRNVKVETPSYYEPIEEKGVKIYPKFEEPPKPPSSKDVKLSDEPLPEVKKNEVLFKKPDVDKQLDKVITNISNKPSVKYYESKINPTVVNKMPVSPSDNIGQLRGHYKKIFTENAKLNDEEILDILIENRGKLQHRFSCQVNVSAKNNRTGTSSYMRLTAVGCLIEHIQNVYNYIRLNQSISFGPGFFDQFINELESKGASVNVDYGSVNTHDSYTINDIKVDCSFA